MAFLGIKSKKEKALEREIRRLKYASYIAAKTGQAVPVSEDPSKRITNEIYGDTLALSLQNTSDSASGKIVLFDANGEVRKARAITNPDHVSITGKTRDYDTLLKRLASGTALNVTGVAFVVHNGEDFLDQTIYIKRSKSYTDDLVSVGSMYPSNHIDENNVHAHRVKVPKAFVIDPFTGIEMTLNAGDKVSMVLFIADEKRATV